MSELNMELSSGIAAFEAKEFSRAMQLLTPLAERGEPQAQCRVAIIYLAERIPDERLKYSRIVAP